VIEAGYVREMARYNAWQNKQLSPVVEAMPLAELTRDCKAFFGSILGTLNHLLWGDTLWMSRFDARVLPPTCGIPDSLEMTPNGAEWALARFEMDGAITRWAKDLRSMDLIGNIDWYSGAAERDMTKPKALCIMQLFNHQTHHRGQVHAMLTAAGQTAPVTDIPFIPEG